MGKQKKLHRKKVQARNQKLVAARKQFEKEMGEMFKQQVESQQMNVYASTGDFVAKNYDKIVQDGSIDYLKEHTDVAFRE